MKNIEAPPELVDVLRLYTTEKLCNLNPIVFYNHYEERNWRDQEGKPIQDWRALLRRWDKNRSSA